METKANSSSRQGSPTKLQSALISRSRRDASPLSTPINTDALDAAMPATVLRAALERRALKPKTPFHADAWECFLQESGLEQIYPSIVPGLRKGFRIGIRTIKKTFSPPNGHSLNTAPDLFNNLIKTEIAAGCWIGPATHADVEAVIGSFQTSPCSAIPRPNKPERRRLIQDFGRGSKDGIKSINSTIEAADFPCTCGSANVAALLIWLLPLGSQISIRDVSDVFRSIPLHPSQWAGVVVRLTALLCAIDANASFGTVSGPGIWGRVADDAIRPASMVGAGPAYQVG